MLPHLNTFTMSEGKKAVFFATQQGTSKRFATQIGEITGIEVVDLAGFNAADLPQYEVALFVVPSYGKGDPPAPAKNFWEGLSESTTELPNLKFAVYGCGDSNFKRSFMGFGKKINEKLATLGATRLTEMGQYDENGDETDVPEWVEKLNL